MKSGGENLRMVDCPLGAGRYGEQCYIRAEDYDPFFGGAKPGAETCPVSQGEEDCAKKLGAEDEEGSDIAIQGIHLGMGNGASFSGERDVSWRGSFFGGLTLGIAGEPFRDRDIGHKLFAIPINANIERVANDLWSFGGDVAARLDLFFTNIDLGVRVAAIKGDDETGLGVTPFARVGFVGDYVGAEAGGLAYSGHGSVDAGRGYVMGYLNLGAIAGLFVRGANVMKKNQHTLY